MKQQQNAKRIHNFCGGPATLPVPVLEALSEDLFSYRGSGIGVLELGHRGKHFEAIIEKAEADLRALLSISDGYTILFTTGGATNQFSMVPLNLLRGGEAGLRGGESGDYLISGVWAEKALEEAGRLRHARSCGSTKSVNFSRVPSELDLAPDSVYVHYTSNNTIYGTQFRSEPDAGGKPLICDASSDLLSRPIDVTKYGLIYAGAQKNLGIAGVTLVIIRKDLLDRCPADLPIMMSYRTYSESKSLYNTPPTAAIYVLGKMLEWIQSEGGLVAMEKLNEQKAKIVYDAIDASELFEGAAEPASRSRMNLTFRLKDASLDKAFLAGAEAEGLVELKGHRSVGGFRASMYNAFPIAGAHALADYLKRFEQTASE